MRSVIINYDKETGNWLLGLLLDHEVVRRRQLANYHEIGSIVSNWIINNIS